MMMMIMMIMIKVFHQNLVKDDLIGSVSLELSSLPHNQTQAVIITIFSEKCNDYGLKKRQMFSFFQLKLKKFLKNTDP